MRQQIKAEDTAALCPVCLAAFTEKENSRVLIVKPEPLPPVDAGEATPEPEPIDIEQLESELKKKKSAEKQEAAKDKAAAKTDSEKVKETPAAPIPSEG